MVDYEFAMKSAAIVLHPKNVPMLSIETTDGLTILATMDAATFESLKRDAMQAMAKIVSRAE
jgi:hypothetical protein